MAIDIIFAIVLIYGFYLGFSRGIIQTIFTILSYVIGLIAAFKFSPSMTNMLESTFSKNPMMFIAGFLLSFVLTMLIIRLFARGLEGILQTVHINVVNQAAGGIFMAGIMVLFYSLILWFADKSNIVTETTKQESMTYSYLEKYPTYVWKAGQKLRPVFTDFWEHTVEFLDQLDKNGVQKTETNPTFYDIEDNNDSTGRR